jgi:hypothetical protein
VISGLPAGLTYFAVTAVGEAAGLPLESEYSIEVSKVVP